MATAETQIPPRPKGQTIFHTMLGRSVGKRVVFCVIARKEYHLELFLVAGLV